MDFSGWEARIKKQLLKSAWKRTVVPGFFLIIFWVIPSIVFPHSTQTVTPVDAAHADAAPVNVAAILSTTGIAAPHNTPLLPLIELAVDEINAEGGILGRPVNLMLIDNRSTPIGSTKAAEKAIENDVVAVIGAHWSSHSLVMAPILQKAEVPMICISTNPEISPIGDYIFRVSFNDIFQAKMLARFARETLQTRRAVIAENINETYSMALADYFSESYRQLGGEILFEAPYKGKAVDFKPIIEQIKALRPEMVFIPGYSRDSGLFIKQAVMEGVDTVFLGADAWDDIAQYAGQALDGSYRSVVWHPGVDTAMSVALQQKHKEKYGALPINYSAVPWYDAFMLLRDAVTRSGSFDRSKIRDALAETKAFQGATGVISFDDIGEVKASTLVILNYVEDREVFFTTISDQPSGMEHGGK